MSLTDDAESVYLVRECSYMYKMTEDGECMHPRVMKEDIMKSDQEKQLVRSSQIRKESPTVATRRCIGW